MSIALPLGWLLDYSDHERRKWRGWIEADPGRLTIPVQTSGRFQTVADLLDHVFLGERRHLSRLEGATPPDATGVPPGDIDALFEFAGLVRADFRRYTEDLDETAADDEMVLTLALPAVTTLRTTRRTVIAQVVLHEIRHFAQIALAARNAGHAPPGEHDILFFPHPGAERRG